MPMDTMGRLKQSNAWTIMIPTQLGKAESKGEYPEKNLE